MRKAGIIVCVMLVFLIVVFFPSGDYNLSESVYLREMKINNIQYRIIANSDIIRDEFGNIVSDNIYINTHTPWHPRQPDKYGGYGPPPEWWPPDADWPPDDWDEPPDGWPEDKPYPPPGVDPWPPEPEDPIIEPPVKPPPTVGGHWIPFLNKHRLDQRVYIGYGHNSATSTGSAGSYPHHALDMSGTGTTTITASQSGIVVFSRNGNTTITKKTVNGFTPTTSDAARPYVIGGEVVRSFRTASTTIQGWAGNCVVLLHNDGSYTVYAHLANQTSATVFIGDQVSRGDPIGVMGGTGTYGPFTAHLHFVMNSHMTSDIYGVSFQTLLNNYFTAWSHQGNMVAADNFADYAFSTKSGGSKRNGTAVAVGEHYTVTK